MHNEIEQIISEPIYIRVRDRIREDILKGVFQPGERLKIDGLSKKYGISHMPIREAIQQLQGEGIVVLEPNKGAIVRKINKKFISNIYDLRSAIEEMLLVNFINNLKDGKDVKYLKKVQGEYDKALNKDNIETCLNCNRDFHRYIYVRADNQEALRIIDQHWGFVKSLRAAYGFNEGRLKNVAKEHHKLIDAIEKKDINLARKIIRSHTESAKEDLLALMKKATNNK